MSLERTRSAPDNMVYDEVCVRMTTSEGRDFLSNQGFKLAGYKKEGKPTAGFRIDVPDFLGAEYKALDNYAWKMKKIHGKETRKHIKFDDQAHSLVLELKLPGEYEYLKISPSLARELKRSYDESEIDTVRPKLTARGSRLGMRPSANEEPINVMGSFRKPAAQSMLASSALGRATTTREAEAGSQQQPYVMPVENGRRSVDEGKQTWKPRPR